MKRGSPALAGLARLFGRLGQRNWKAVGGDEGGEGGCFGVADTERGYCGSRYRAIQL
jgi:hypothetical protein